MWKSIVYKEWLKIRWFLIGFTVLGIAGIGYLFLKVQHGFTFQGGTSFWYNILFMGLQFFGFFKYFPLFGGLLIGVAQYFPETINKRIKLTFHLPLKENNVLLMMHAFGFVCLVLSYVLLLGVFITLSSFYFPSQMVFDSIVTITPWFLAGLVAYFFGEFSNSFVLAKMKIFTKGKWLWTRTIGSTIVGELVDSTLFILIAFFGIFPNSLLITLIVSNYLFKTAVEILFTPMTYKVVSFLKKKESEDYYDTDTNFNPFVNE